MSCFDFKCSSKPTCDNIVPIKGILKSGTARDDHQKVVCFTGPAPDEHREQKKPVEYPPGQQPHFTDDPNFCEKYKEAVSPSVRQLLSFEDSFEFF